MTVTKHKPRINAMTCPFKAATIRETYTSGATLFVVYLDKDAAEIMGETKLRYVYGSKEGAEKFAAVLQSNLDEAYADACGE